MNNLREERKRLLLSEQTADREYRLAIIDLEITIRASEINLEMAKKTLFLIDAWRRTGSMSVALPDGRIYTDVPRSVACSIQSMWNVKYKAADMARLACGV